MWLIAPSDQRHSRLQHRTIKPRNACDCLGTSWKRGLFAGTHAISIGPGAITNQQISRLSPLGRKPFATDRLGSVAREE